MFRDLVRRRKTILIWALPILAVLIFVFGVFWRGHFILVAHPMQNYIYSDMQTYATEMVNYYQPGYHLGPSDVFYPPGTSLIFGFFYHHFHQSWFVLGLVQLFFSIMTPLVLAVIGYLLYGRRVGLTVLIMSSLYIGFVEYSGFLLSETAFEFFFYAGLLVLVLAMRSKIAKWRWLAGLGSGLLFAVACSVRSNGLLPIVCLIILLLLYARLGKKWLYPVALGCLGGLVLLVLPMSARCTSINGHFCALGTNSTLGILQGHYGRVGHFNFNDPIRGTHYEYGNPTTLQEKNEETASFQFGPYDSGAVAAAAANWIKANPWWSLKLSVGHILNLFYGSVPWPSSHTSGRTRIILSERLFRVFILLPALAYCLALAFWPAARKLKHRDYDLMLIVPIIGLMLVVFITVAEPRYRIPFDGLLIILAVRAYTFGRTDDSTAEPNLVDKRRRR